MSVIYQYGLTKFLGNTRFERVTEDPVFTVDSFGADKCKIRFRGAVVFLAAYIKTLVRFSPLGSSLGSLAGPYPNMYLTEWENDEDPLFPTVTLTYMGSRNALEKPAEVSTTSTQQTVTFQAGATTYFIKYLAPRTTYKWVQYKQPGIFPKYNKSRFTTKDFIDQIILQYPQLAPYKANLSANVLYNFLTDFQAEEIVPGKVWVCNSSVDNILASPSS